MCGALRQVRAQEEEEVERLSTCKEAHRYKQLVTGCSSPRMTTFIPARCSNHYGAIVFKVCMHVESVGEGGLALASIWSRRLSGMRALSELTASGRVAMEAKEKRTA